MTQYSPLEDRILILPKKETEPAKTAGGLYDQSTKPVQEATVYAIGPGMYARESGVFMPTMLKKGDVVLVARDGGVPFSITTEEGKTEDLKLLRESDVLMLISKKED